MNTTQSSDAGGFARHALRELEQTRALAEARKKIALVLPSASASEAHAWLRAARAAGLLTSSDIVAEALELVESLVDPDDCWFDHHGGCQAHGYLDLTQGEVCPVQHAKDFLAEHKPEKATTP